MDNFDMPPMKFHNFVRLFVFPLDFVSTAFLFYNYIFKGQSFFSSPYRYAIYTLLAIKAIQTIVNIVTQIGFVTFSGYSFYGIFIFFGLRILFYTIAYLTRTEPALGSMPDIVALSLLSDYFVEGPLYQITLIFSMISSILLMGVIVLYYFVRKDAFYFRESRGKRTKPIHDRNYPWRYNEKYKPYRKPHISPRKLHGIKERRLDVVSGKENASEENPEADINEGL